MKDKKVLIILIIAAVIILVQKLDLDLALKDKLDLGQVEGVSQEISDELKVIFFDVGQGDAIFIETPQQRQILIDGGEGNVILEKLNECLDPSDREIDLIILTHPHSDHVSGLVEVLRNYQVNEVWLTGVIHNSNVYLEFLNLIKEKEIPTKIVWSCGNDIIEECSDIVEIEDNLNFKVLYPLKNLIQQKVDNLNNSSIVLKLDYFNSSILFTGDAELEAEADMLANFELTDFEADILKIGHHGSSDASSQEFISAVGSDYTVISVGANNSFDHPALRTIRRLERLGVEILRTDERGDIKFIINEDEIKLK